MVEIVPNLEYGVIRAALNIVLKFAEVLGLSVDDDTEAEVRAKLIALLDIPEGLADGDYGDFVVEDGEATLTAAGVVAAIAAMDGAMAEAVVDALADAIQAAVTGNPFPAAALADFVAGTDDNVYPSGAAIRHLGLVKALSYAASVTIRLDGAREDDGDDHDSDTLISTLAATGDCDFGFDGILSGLVRQRGEIIVANSGGGARDIDVVTANGVTVTWNVANPGLGSGAGDTLEILYTIVSPTHVRIDGAQAFPA